MIPGLQKGRPDEPVAQNTSIGWILVGGNSLPHITINLSLNTCIDIDSRLRSFWESEEPTATTRLSEPDDLQSEYHFKDTHSCDESGRYTVRLTFKTTSSPLGSSRPNAISRLFKIERKLSKNPLLAKDYSDFMKEYESLGHMK